ncbi:uncharacterized protein LOC126897907 [Daktulosphaira vitifoliae]|uniref:uncharacterized protein LOC126897907 n=1 Tax=Daktulosphaira vitifoliae TaxID=58002 RepID=UPI0021A99BF1|nr:uncharacterized protein LOC126897907 [Daktulosphaira vitifoliae]
MWHFPNCIGAIDEKHINIECPINSGSTFFNYKGSHSVVLLALVDADYKFIAVDVGSYGRNSDGGIFSKSTIGKRLSSNTFNVPKPIPITENIYHILSRARRVVENAFGILAARWRCFRKNLEVQPEFVDKIVLSSCCLHNMLCGDNAFEPEDTSTQNTESALTNLDFLRRNCTRDAFNIREKFKEYFISEVGRVPWQLDRVRKGRNT